ncbi:MAG: cupredoxin domain-containing protein [Nocardioidaceae bacterium]
MGSVVVLVLATLALGSPGASSAAPSGGPRHFTVRVGHDIEAGAKSRPADLMRFLPGTLSVHRGDTVTFVGEFHTATALPVHTRPGPWISTHARRLGQRFFFLSHDDEPGVLQFNPRVLYPQHCNLAKPCRYTGRRLVSSGGLGLAAPRKVAFTIDARAGQKFWVICLIHPQMRMLVHVVPNGTAIQTQAQIDRATHKRVAAATAHATRVWNALQHQRSHVSNGRRIVDAFAGFDTKAVELFGMFPRVLHVKTGATVMWHFRHLRFEPHSVVFPAGTAQRISTGPPPLCEPNHGSKDVPATRKFTCPKGSHGPVEIELDPRLIKPGGSHSVTSASGYHNSGARGGFDIANSRPYSLRFPVHSPTHGFRYACGVHGLMMTGFVKVR